MGNMSNLQSGGYRKTDTFTKLVRRVGIKHVVAISDIHGWYGPFVELLERGGIIRQVAETESLPTKKNVFTGGEDDGTYQYIGGETTLILVGDTVDGDANTEKVIDLLIKLENQANISGGEVIVLMGNHEQTLLQTSWRGCELGQTIEWIRDRPAVAIVNDVLFVHGGIDRRVLKRVEKAQLRDEDFISAFRRVLEDRRIATEVTTSAGNWYYEDDLRKILEKTGTNYTVIGHISTYGKISSEIRLIGAKIDGQRRVFAIDTEISDYKRPRYGYNGGALSLRWTKAGIEAEYIYI
jgi:hypothetical protein